MIIDIHVKLGPSFDNKGKSVEDYIVQMEENNITYAMLCPNKPKNYSLDDANNYILQVINRYSDKFFGAYRVGPWNWDSSKDKLKAFFGMQDKYKFMYLNPWEDNFRINGASMHPIFEYAGGNNIPILIETGYPFVSHITQVGEAAQKYGEVKFIVTNAGQLDLSGFTLADVNYQLSFHKNIYLVTSPAVGAEWLANMITNTAEGRVVFGSSYPFCDVYMEKYRITNSYVDDAHKKDVFYKNASKLIYN